ncbi:MAG: RNA methyltransferase PUA domain-containing protein [Saprospiraceae bacterium]
MNIFYASKLDVGSDEYKMDDSEWHHCHKVMRLGMNDAIHFFTGDGTLRYGKIVSANKTLAR